MKPHKILSRLFLLAFITTLFASHSKGQQSYNDNGLLIQVLEVQEFNKDRWQKAGVYQTGLEYRLKFKFENTNCDRSSNLNCYRPNRYMFIRDVELTVVIQGAEWVAEDKPSNTSIQRFLTDCSQDMDPQSSRTFLTNKFVYAGRPVVVKSLPISLKSSHRAFKKMANTPTGSLTPLN